MLDEYNNARIEVICNVGFDGLFDLEQKATYHKAIKGAFESFSYAEQSIISDLLSNSHTEYDVCMRTGYSLRQVKCLLRAFDISVGLHLATKVEL